MQPAHLTPGDVVHHVLKPQGLGDAGRESEEGKGPYSHDGDQCSLGQ